MRIYVDNQGIFVMNFKENETAAQFLQRFKDENEVHFKSAATLWWIGDGHTLLPDEIILDRDHYLTAWLERAL
jgi:hypothetical protein